jgi:hypothetical protein
VLDPLPKDNFTQMLNNQPIIQFRNTGVGTEVKHKVAKIQCEIYKPPILDTDGVIIPVGGVESKMRRFKKGIKQFYKSNDDILNLVAQVDQIDAASSNYKTIKEFCELSVQVGDSLNEKEDEEKDDTSDDVEQTTAGKKKGKKRKGLL